MLEIVVMLMAVIIGIGVGALCFNRLQEWSLRIETIAVGESSIRYRYVLGSDVGLFSIGFLLLICAIVSGNREPTETSWPAFAFMGFSLTLYAIFALVSGYLCQTTLIVTSTQIQVYQQRGLGLWKRQCLLADVVSEILHGKRELNVRQIRVLAQRFGVSPAVFF